MWAMAECVIRWGFKSDNSSSGRCCSDFIPIRFNFTSQQQLKIATTSAALTTASALGINNVENQKQPQLRRLILLRHAHSSWSDPNLRDYERRLTKQGRKAAASIAMKLRDKGWIPQLILCSIATRTQETLNIMQRQCVEFMKSEVKWIESYYSVAAMDGHTAQHLQQTVCTHAPDTILTVLCMGHNRGWEEAASSFAATNVELKTANAALLQGSGSCWKHAFANGWKLYDVLRPEETPVEIE